MTTIIISENVTMTISEEKAREWYAYKEAVARADKAYGNSEAFGDDYGEFWDYMEEFYGKVWDAWERFCS